LRRDSFGHLREGIKRPKIRDIMVVRKWPKK